MSYEARVLTPNLSFKRMLAALGLSAVALAPASCSIFEDREYKSTSDLSPAERVVHDYTGRHVGTAHLGDSCLNSTAYDPYSPAQTNAVAAVVTMDRDKAILVYPAGSEKEPLKLVDEGGDKPLQPGNDAAKLTLQIYGCQFDSYPAR